MTIRNESKWTISISGGLEMLQMVSEPDTGGGGVSERTLDPQEG